MAEIGGAAFGKARKAREALRERAEEIVRLYFETWKQALAAGDYETAQKCASDLAKHIPKDEDGSTVFDPDIDKKVEATKQLGPSIQMGIVIGGINKQLPQPTVEVVEIPVKATQDDSTE